MEGLCFRPSPPLIGIPSPPVAAGLDARAHHPQGQVSAATRSAGSNAEVAPGKVVPWHSYASLRRLVTLWPTRDEGGRKDEILVEDEEEKEEEVVTQGRRNRGNWAMKILRVGSTWEGERESAGGGGGDDDDDDPDDGDDDVRSRADAGDRCIGCCDDEGCVVDDGSEEEVKFDRDSFSRLLRRVSLNEARLYRQLSYLGSLAYCIPKFKPGFLLKYRLRFVTSSLEKKAKSSNVEAESSTSQPREEIIRSEAAEEAITQRITGISASSAYQIAASAASYLQSQTKGIIPYRSQKRDAGSDFDKEAFGSEIKSDVAIPEESSFVATTNSVTAVVAAKEEAKEAVANDLNSSRSSPCEWFICDNDRSGTRYFVIQGSESLASWQANLLFEPVQFEGFNVLVHRGIYEAAKGIYEQMLPEVRSHLETHGKSARLCFTGHSLGGSLSLLVNLMLLVRSEALASSLLPVVTFGAPTIMCGGNYLLQKLGLPLSHIQSITMHRDIVPRAFSCNYPDHVAKILKAVNKNFRNHPCLKHQKLLYEPMGEFLILQPDEKYSPHHHLLPTGSGLYVMIHPSPDSINSGRLLQTAKSVFLNSPHPLDILRDANAYGSNGTVTRDHDMGSYLSAIQHTFHVEFIRTRKVKEERRRRGNRVGIIIEWRFRSLNLALDQINLSGVYEGGIQSLRQFQKLVVSKHDTMLLVLLVPVRILLLKALAAISFS